MAGGNSTLNMLTSLCVNKLLEQLGVLTTPLFAIEITISIVMIQYFHFMPCLTLIAFHLNILEKVEKVYEKYFPGRKKSQIPNK